VVNDPRLGFWFGSVAFCLALHELRPVCAQQAEHHLFSPVPRDAMRDLSTDRPNTTESPFTVDAGHLQIELEFVALGFDRDASASTTGVQWLTTKFRLGVLTLMDLQLIVMPHARSVMVSQGGEEVVSEGMVRSPRASSSTLWGNDSCRATMTSPRRGLRMTSSLQLSRSRRTVR
jgi:hypothetical protein